METTLIIHILGGTGGLVAGYLALLSRKGQRLHRRAGLVFVWSMLVMCGAGLAVTLARSVAVHINVPASVLAAALVITAFTSVRERTRGVVVADALSTMATVGVTLTCVALAVDSIAGSRTHAQYTFPYVMFSVAGAIASLGDVRIWRHGPPSGTRRIARHLWRMCFALFIAAMSFFLGQARLIPEPIRIMPLLAAAPLSVLAVMSWWLVRMKRKSKREYQPVAPYSSTNAGVLTTGD